ncbi:hypothetical protein EUX98_g5943 [Antrodiella citrinella]|uniref:Uncharacterized protein n=1 Tax=Antrodiella citrinella TaxID=2447956 RepID=A0A4S4MSD8_9APHY|nr:hypothetical protein EUX98_g5943 [Antrodiella citrinella]
MSVRHSMRPRRPPRRPDEMLSVAEQAGIFARGEVRETRQTGEESGLSGPEGVLEPVVVNEGPDDWLNRLSSIEREEIEDDPKADDLEANGETDQEQEEAVLAVLAAILGGPERVGEGPERVGEGPERVGEGPERVGEGPERVATEESQEPYKGPCPYRVSWEWQSG